MTVQKSLKYQSAPGGFTHRTHRAKKNRKSKAGNRSIRQERLLKKYERQKLQHLLRTSGKH